ncbi:hypothetical protein PHLGIDRAFT_125945 [Phlebiopsis gigantea 11061_1 CR5-6]|uniref:G-alpha-domain-containing protein n=1 Tax=Phlebiopsis gigantea (strain 11061_1 CR5-6) TaxID=745531 RepID=A0A0C3PRQ8_PHLG1|nr:hypothetical protein PHLGIDRAFT_125945 [Phlebiopsis gigantea 11061_1 CR5-6]
MPGAIKMRRAEGEDPLSLLLTPPIDETHEEREQRLQREAEAVRVSEGIDEVIQRERDALKNQKVLKMLLLGQSESGKSTTLKNIQMIQAPDTWHAERSSWRVIVQLNLVRAVNTMLEALSSAMADGGSGSPTAEHPYLPQSFSTPQLPSDGQDDLDFASSTTPSSPTLSYQPLQFTDAHLSLKLRLGPLRRVEADLKKFLGAASEEVTESSLQGDYSSLAATPFDYPGQPSSSGKHREFAVRSHNAWKSTIMNDVQHDALRPTSPNNNATDVISALRDDMMALWRDDCVLELLRRRKIVLEDSEEYFLHHLPRIASRSYEPTDDDVIRARIRTLGVQEYHIPFQTAKPSNIVPLGTEWRIFDVGGARTTRHAWLPYFDDVQAILFLAPISCFDEKLAEDRRVNRLKDSVILWKSIVGSKLLENCTIILFLNKCDLLKKKLDSGVMVNRFIPRYGQRENNSYTFSKYIKEKFKEYMREYSPKARQFYGFFTSAIDTRATATTLASIQDSILQAHLQEALI